MEPAQLDDQPSAPPRTPPPTESCVEVQHDGRVCAAADISTTEQHGTADVVFRAEHHDLPPEVRRDLVDAVLADPGVQGSDHLHAVLPMGDGETISRLQHRTTNLTSRAAGASSVVDADLEGSSEAGAS